MPTMNRMGRGIREAALAAEIPCMHWHPQEGCCHPRYAALRQKSTIEACKDCGGYMVPGIKTSLQQRILEYTEARHMCHSIGSRNNPLGRHIIRKMYRPSC